MKPVVVLVAASALCRLAFSVLLGNIDLILCGRFAMAAMLLYTAIAHFKFNKGMAMTLPDFIPMKAGVVYFTGLIKIAAAIGLIIDGTHYLTAILLVMFFILILPANIIGAKQKVDIEQANHEGYGIGYLWFRVPLQLFFIGWVIYFAILN
jgi:uncharacterized membrane protein